MHNVVLYIIVFISGSVIGSFLNVCIYRIPRRLSVVFPSSRCPSCNSPIHPADNIPIVSFILLRGRCRQCKTGIPVRYPLVEFLNALLYVIVVWRYGPAFSWFLLLYLILVSTLVVITFIDIDHQIIPDGITLSGIPLALIFSSTLLPDPFSRADLLGFKASLAGVVLGGGLFYCIGVVGSLIFRKEAMGGGDIKMMAMLGGILGWKGVLLTAFLGSFFGSIAGVSLVLIKGWQMGAKIPFGPYLAFGAILSLLFGQEFLTIFLNAR